MAESTRKTAAAKIAEQSEAEAAGTGYAQSRIDYLKSIGLAVGGRYKTVWHGQSYIGGVQLVHISIDQEYDQTALIFQTDGAKDAPYQVIMLEHLAAFTIAN